MGRQAPANGPLEQLDAPRPAGAAVDHGAAEEDVVGIFKFILKSYLILSDIILFFKQFNGFKGFKGSLKVLLEHFDLEQACGVQQL